MHSLLDSLPIWLSLADLVMRLGGVVEVRNRMGYHMVTVTLEASMDRCTGSRYVIYIEYSETTLTHLTSYATSYAPE